MKTTIAEMKKALAEAGLENAGEGVVFPWGVKIVEVDGKKMLQPMTPEEYRKNVKAETGRELTDEQVGKPSCVYATGGCVSQGCRQAGGTCSLHHDSGGWYCLCDY